MSSSHTAPTLCKWFLRLACVLDARSATRYALLLMGAALSRGRQTVTAWVRASGSSGQYKRSYNAVAAAGRNADKIASRLAEEVVKPVMADAKRLTFAIDDTTTERFGEKVQGAGVHHNATPGPAGSEYVYGHVWVTLGLLADHSAWGNVALPLLARLYVREKDIPAVPEEVRPEFRTKLVMAVELLQWAKRSTGEWGKQMWVAADGAYAKAAFLKPAKGLGFTVVSRLRKDSALCSVPEPREPSQKGRPRVYGDKRIELAKRAGQKGGWSHGTFTLYGKKVVKKYKTFVATWRPAGGAIRVVLLDEPHGWVAFFCTDINATESDILTTVAARFSLETAFRDAKQHAGAGDQQVRKLHANVGAFHTCIWTMTMTEAWAWSRPAEQIVDRSASPWDDPNRRPSHADKRRARRRELLADEIQAAMRPGANAAEIAAAAQRLLDMAA